MLFFGLVGSSNAGPRQIHWESKFKVWFISQVALSHPLSLGLAWSQVWCPRVGSVSSCFKQLDGDCTGGFSSPTVKDSLDSASSWLCMNSYLNEACFRQREKQGPEVVHLSGFHQGQKPHQ